MPELLLCCALWSSHSCHFSALKCWILLLKICLLFNHLRSSAFPPFSTCFCHFCFIHTSLSPFFLHKLMRFLILSFISLTWWSLGAKRRLSFFACFFTFLLNVITTSSSLNYYTSILFVLHKCRNFFSVAHFGAAILVFPARLGAASYCCNCSFCSTTYVRPLSHLSLLAFVTFVFFTLRCHLFFILRCHLFFFINLSDLSYCLSFLLPDEASGRNVVNSTVSCSPVCCSLNSWTSIPFLLHKCRNFFCVEHFGAAILVFSARFGAA